MMAYIFPFNPSQEIIPVHSVNGQSVNGQAFLLIHADLTVLRFWPPLKAITGALACEKLMFYITRSRLWMASPIATTSGLAL
jgi:hypothetical protein